jgi:hypothetical protein
MEDERRAVEAAKAFEDARRPLISESWPWKAATTAV